MQRAVAMHEGLARDQPEVYEYQNGLDSSHRDLVDLYRTGGRWADAEGVIRRVVATWEGLIRDHPELTEIRVRLGDGYREMGDLLRDRGELGAACDWYIRAVQALREALEQEPTHVRARQSLLAALCCGPRQCPDRTAIRRRSPGWTRPSSEPKSGRAIDSASNGPSCWPARETSVRPRRGRGLDRLHDNPTRHALL